MTVSICILWESGLLFGGVLMYARGEGRREG